MIGKKTSTRDFSADWKGSDSDHLSQDLSEIVKNRSLSGVGPVGARRRWFYSILHQLFVYITERTNKDYTGTQEERFVSVTDLVLAHPIDEHSARITTIERAIKAIDWLQNDIKKVCNASSSISADKVVMRLSHEAISKKFKTPDQIWGFDLGGKILVMDGNGRAAALKWAVNHPLIDKSCISFRVPVAISKPEGRAKSLVTLLVRKLYACSDQGCYMEKLNGLFRRKLPTDTDAAEDLEMIAELLDTSTYPTPYDIKNKYGAESECHIESEKCSWILFMGLMKIRYKDFSMFYSQVVQQTTNATYAIDCVQRDQGACIQDGWYDPDGYDSDSSSDSDW